LIACIARKNKIYKSLKKKKEQRKKQVIKNNKITVAKRKKQKMVSKRAQGLESVEW